MDMNDKLLADLAAQLGLGPSAPSGPERPSRAGSAAATDRMADLADKYRGKSDQELISEIMKVKHALKRDRAQFENQMRTIKALRSMMGGEQRARLDKLIRLLEEDD
jgi:hypothetical protein